MRHPRFRTRLGAVLAQTHPMTEPVTFDKPDHIRPRLVHRLEKAAAELRARRRILRGAAVDRVAEFFAAQRVADAFGVDGDEADRAVEAVDGEDLDARDGADVLHAVP